MGFTHVFEVDWQKPWFEPLACIGAPVLERWREHLQGASSSSAWENLHEVLNEERRLRGLLPDFSFVAQAQKPDDVSYEEFIFDTHQIPTRDNAHDFFNALSWFTCPQTKKALNRLQAQEIKKQGIGDRRGKLRDALTLFDENVMCISCSDDMWAAICAHEWVSLFWDSKHKWPSAELHVFGHALLEKLLHPYKAITAHVVRVDFSAKLEDRSLVPHPSDAIMEKSALDLIQLVGNAAPKPFQVMPVMGIPGWWPEETSLGFYEDHAVFRPKADVKPQTGGL